ncbi:unnamed protein product [Mytilus coruscus]|uniref:Uncharacterized protein n=1 Tax=Mytilus coruscus TaxID=42192 RepID=A0A6J8AX52_MYTCO|nr:unnamed protein product [Mytilus coruscus]
MPKRKKRQNVPYHRKRSGTGKLKLDKGQTEILAIRPNLAHDKDLLPSEAEELICTSVDSVSLDHSYLSDNQTVAELCLDEEIDVVIDQHIEECVIVSYETLKKTVCTSLTSPYVYNSAASYNLQIIEHYPSSKSVYVKLTIIINKDFSAKVYVHGIELSREHDIWLGLPSVYDNITSIERLLSKLRSYTVCSGNHEQEFS